MRGKLSLLGLVQGHITEGGKRPRPYRRRQKRTGPRLSFLIQNETNPLTLYVDPSVPQQDKIDSVIKQLPTILAFTLYMYMTMQNQFVDQVIAA